MLHMGLKIGADVPFCIKGGTYLAEGIGEKLTKLNDFIWDYILVVKPEFSMSTAFVYKNLLPEFYNSYSCKEILSFLNRNDYLSTVLSSSNTLEKVVEKFHPEINHIKSLMLENNAVSSHMTGSGSAVFGFFKDKVDMDIAYNKIIKVYPQTFKTKTSYTGTEICV